MQHVIQSFGGASSKPRSLSQPGKFVTAGGDNMCHVIIEGALASHHLLPNGEEQVSGYYLPGDVCGLSSFSRLGRDDQIIALTPTVTARIPFASLMELAETSPAIARALLRQMSVETAVARQWIINIGLRSAFLRIAHLACELESRLRAVDLVNVSSFRWFGTQKDLAAATGLSVVHVNRSLQKLKSDKLVDWKTTNVRILDAERLQALVNFDPGYLDLGKPKLSELLLAGDHGRMEDGLGDDRQSSSLQNGILSAVNGG